MLTVNEVCSILDDVEDFLKDRKNGVDNTSKTTKLAERIVEFQQTCIDCGMDDCESTDTVEDIANWLVNDVKFWRWLEEKGIEYADFCRLKELEADIAANATV